MNTKDITIGGKTSWMLEEEAARVKAALTLLHSSLSDMPVPKGLEDDPNAKTLVPQFYALIERWVYEQHAMNIKQREEILYLREQLFKWDEPTPDPVIPEGEGKVIELSASERLNLTRWGA